MRIEITNEWSDKLKNLRKSSGLSLRDFCYKLSGIISPSTLCRLEKGEQKYVSNDLILALSNYSGTNFMPIHYTCDEALRSRIIELENENRILRDYITMKWGEEETNCLKTKV